MKAQEKTIEDRLLRLALSQVVSDLSVHGVHGGCNGRFGWFPSVDSAVDELI